VPSPARTRTEGAGGAPARWPSGTVDRVGASAVEVDGGRWRRSLEEAPRTGDERGGGGRGGGRGGEEALETASIRAC